MKNLKFKKILICFVISVLLISALSISCFAADQEYDPNYDTFTLYSEAPYDAYCYLTFDFFIPSLNLTFDSIEFESSDYYVIYGYHHSFNIYDENREHLLTYPNDYIWTFDSLTEEQFNALKPFGTFSYSSDQPTSWYDSIYSVITNAVFGEGPLSPQQDFICSFFATLLCLFVILVPFLGVAYIFKLIFSF